MSDERDTQPSEPKQPLTPRSMPLPRAAPEGGDATRQVSGTDADATIPHDSDATVRHSADATRTLSPAEARGVALPAAIGPYKILGLLGVGGFGAVYEAQQARPNRIVALKVIKPGYISPSLLKRFERETEVLGRLQHPGIAQVYEAGTANEGDLQQPYFAMELVRGTTLTRFADEKKLDLRQRLDLVTRLCDAVQYAHQQGVVHRDLKPGNILVDAAGQPKILDFGIAKIAGNEAQLSTMETQVGQLVGTLPYMSPEQARGEVDKLDTRSDIYALGVIAYELLAGKLPYDLKQAVILEAVRVICEDEPTPLSSVDRRFGGDVQTIIAKAMAKEKERRYASASELASDIKRFLNDEPITARPPSTWYQLSKFARRNKALVSGLAAVIVVLILGVAGTSLGMVRAQRAEKEAVVQRGEAKRQASEAIKQWSIAESQRKIAQQQKELAETERRRAVSALREARHQLAQNLIARTNDASMLVVDAKRAVEKSGLSDQAAALRLSAAYQFIPPALSVLEELQSPEQAGPPANVLCVATTPDGRRALTGDELGVLRLWDVPTGTLIRRIAAHASPVTAIALTPDGNTAVSSGGVERARVSGGGPHSDPFRERADRNLRVWDLKTGQQTHLLKGRMGRVSISSDANLVVSVNWEDGVIRIWNVASEKEIKTHTVEASGPVALSPDRKFIAVARGNVVSMFGIDSGTLNWDSSATIAHDAKVLSVVFSPDGRRVVSGGDHTARVWDAATGTELDTFDHGAAVAVVAFAPQGREVYSIGNDGRIERWEQGSGNTGRHAGTLHGDAPEVRVAAIAPEGHLLFTAVGATVRVCDLSTGMESAELSGHNGSVPTVAISRDGRLAATCDTDKSLVLWDIATRQPLRTTPAFGELNCMEFAPDGRKLLTAHTDRGLNLIDLSTGNVIHKIALDGDAASGVSFSHDGGLFAAGSANWVAVWDATSGKRLAHWSSSELLGVRTTLRPGVGFSPDAQQVFALSRHGYGKAWSISSGQMAWTSSHVNKMGSIGASAFFRDGRRALSATHDLHQLKVWDFTTGEALLAFERPVPARVVRLSADESLAFTAGFDGVLALWDAANGREIVRWLGHDSSALKLLPDGDLGKALSSVLDASISADGTIVLSSGCDKTLKLWDLSRAAGYREGLAKADAARRRLKDNSADAGALAELGAWYAFRGRWAWAIELLEKARLVGARVSPLMQARCLWRLKTHRQAAAAFERAIAAHEAPEEYLRLCREATSPLDDTGTTTPAGR